MTNVTVWLHNLNSKQTNQTLIQSTIKQLKVCFCDVYSNTVNSWLITGSWELLFQLNDELNREKYICPWKTFLKGIIPIQFWASTYQSRGLMNRPTAWPSFAEYWAFEKRATWMDYMVVFMSVFAYKELHLFISAWLTVWSGKQNFLESAFRCWHKRIFKIKI